MKDILNNLHVAILASLTVGKMVFIQSECKSLTTQAAFSVCERTWDGDNRPKCQRSQRSSLEAHLSTSLSAIY